MADVVAWVASPLAHASDTPAHITSHPGGGGANVAERLVEAGVPTLLVARIGEDAAGREAVEELRRAGVDLEVAIDPARATGTCIVIVEPGGERTMLPDRGANAALATSDLPDRRVRRGQAPAPLGLRAARPGLALGRAGRARARAGGEDVDLGRPGLGGAAEEVGPRTFLGWTRHADLLLPNAEEAAVLTGARDPEAAAWALARDGREVVITLGKDGALWSDGEHVERAQASPAPARVDSTGAGDAFTAGWLGARLRGAEPPEALAEGELHRRAGDPGARRALTTGGRREGRGSRSRARRPRRRGSPATARRARRRR